MSEYFSALFKQESSVSLFRHTLLSLAVASSILPVAQASTEVIVVVGSRTGIESERLGRAHTIIDRRQLEATPARNIGDVLRQVPGLSIAQSGGLGGLTQIRARGAEANHILVLIDGIEVSAASTGEYDLSALTTGNIERIEVLRGPQSAFWGSNASAGVINIITRESRGEGLQLTADAELGAENTRQSNLHLAGGDRDLNFALSGGLRRTDGFNVSNFGSEKDGDINRTLQGKLNIRLSDTLQLKLNSRYVNRDSEFDSQDFAFPATATQGRVIDTDSIGGTTEWANAARLNWQQGDFSQQLHLEHSRNDRRSNDAGSASGSDSDRSKIAWQGSYSFAGDNAEHTLTGGIEREREQFENVFPNSPDQAGERKRTLTGYILQYQGEFDERLSLTAATRYDNNDAFKNFASWSLSAALRLDGDLRLHSSAGTGITNPTFYEQFGFSPSSFVGNPDLKPEENFGWDIGLAFPLGERHRADVTYFNERLTNEIVTVYDSSFNASPVNSDGTSRRQGVELALDSKLHAQLNSRLSYTYTDSTDASGIDEVRRPRHSANIALDWQSADSRTDINLNASYNSSTQDLEFISSTPQTRVTLDNYWLLNLGASYQLNQTVQLYGRIENLLDEDYEKQFDENTQGRAAFVGVRARF